MSARARGFGAVAAAYERFRPGYPDELATPVLAHARRPVRTALEIGAGTGKATRVFAAHGIAVTATDPDPAMLAELRRHVPPGVRTVEASFEELRPDGTTYDLVFAAAALHWTAPAGRWPRVAALLAPGGVVASVGGPVRVAEPAVAALVAAARSPYLADDEIPSPDGTPPGSAMQWPGTELRRSPLFTDVRQIVLPRRLTMTVDEFTGYLSTVSAYLQLPGGTRAAVFAALRRTLPPTVEIAANLWIHLARRVT